MTFWEFWNANPFLAWCALWLFWGIVPIATVAASLITRLYRAVMVSARGWPPEHLDADGDWRPADETPNVG